MLHVFTFLWFVSGCAPKAAPAPDVAPDPTPVAAHTDCPEGVKLACNVPNVTQKTLQKTEAVIQQCIADCIYARQAEAISADQIQQQCESGCMEEHFIGQVEVVPDGGETKE